MTRPAEVVTRETDAPASHLARFLPGPVPDRTVWPGWDRWRRSRRDFAPAPEITLAAYERMSARQRRLHDLHRIATHSNLVIQETPMSSHVAWSGPVAHHLSPAASVG